MGPQVTRHADAQPLIQRAVDLFQQGKLAEAQDLCEQVLQTTRDHFDALHLLGVIACQGGQLERGLKFLDKAISINPQVAEAHNDRGRALQALGQFNEAFASYHQALELKPDYARAHRNRASALILLKRFEEASVSYEKAFKLDP